MLNKMITRCKEILIEDGLYYISTHLEELHEVNLIGNTSWEILDMPEEVAKCFDNEDGFYILKEREYREKIGEFGLCHPEIIQIPMPYGKTKYLEEFLCEERVKHSTFEHLKALEFIGRYGDDFLNFPALNEEDFEEYNEEEWYLQLRDYWELREQVRELEALPLEIKFYGMDNTYERAKVLMNYILNKEALDEELEHLYKGRFPEYSDGKLRIVSPKNVEELLFVNDKAWTEIEKLFAGEQWIYFIKSVATNEVEAVLLLDWEDTITLDYFDLWEITESELYSWFLRMAKELGYSENRFLKDVDEMLEFKRLLNTVGEDGLWM